MKKEEIEEAQIQVLKQYRKHVSRMPNDEKMMIVDERLMLIIEKFFKRFHHENKE